MLGFGRESELELFVPSFDEVSASDSSRSVSPFPSQPSQHQKHQEKSLLNREEEVITEAEERRDLLSVENEGQGPVVCGQAAKKLHRHLTRTCTRQQRGGEPASPFCLSFLQ